MSLDEVRRFLQGVDLDPLDRDSSPAKAALAALKREAVGRGDQDAARSVWCFEQVVGIQDQYLEAFRLLKQNEFYKAWCTLERVEIQLEWLARHFTPGGDEYRLQTIERLTTRLQELFPYAVFMSTEMVAKKKECTICGREASLRNSCGHRVGEIYNGEMCGRRITEAELAGMALTDKPANKYSVAFAGPEGKTDHYDYSMLRGLLARLEGPFQEWGFETSIRYLPHERFKDAGRNDPCPCKSGEKYKRCCLPETGVRALHYEVWIGNRGTSSPTNPPLSWVRL
jgi:hypothetical protein